MLVDGTFLTHALQQRIFVKVHRSSGLSDCFFFFFSFLVESCLRFFDEYILNYIYAYIYIYMYG